MNYNKMEKMGQLVISTALGYAIENDVTVNEAMSVIAGVYVSLAFGSSEDGDDLDELKARMISKLSECFDGVREANKK